MEVLNINLKRSWFALVWKTIYIMIITTVSGATYSAILLSNQVLDSEKLAAYAGCKVQVTSVFVRSNSLKEGFYFLPDGRIVKEPEYGYASCISYSDVEAWKSLNQDGRVYVLECGRDKDGDEFYSGRTPLAASLA